MTYSAVAAVLHTNDPSNAAFETAISFARKHDVHLHVLCLGMDHSETGYYYAGAQTFVIQQNFELAQAMAKEVQTIAQTRLQREDIKWDIRAVTVMPGGLTALLSDTMRFYDLNFLRTPYQLHSNDIDRQIFETCLFSAGAPVLMVPDDARTDGVFDRVMVAWDDGQQALASVRAARPLITQADLVEITIVDPAQHGPDRSDPGGRVASYLARSGASADIVIMARTLPSVAEQLLQIATERQMELIVMGAYGHSPLREAILGGATRDMLRNAKMPILMAH
jgi:nucleotide-binding universal stress UspA family protein